MTKRTFGGVTAVLLGFSLTAFAQFPGHGMSPFGISDPVRFSALGLSDNSSFSFAAISASTFSPSVLPESLPVASPTRRVSMGSVTGQPDYSKDGTDSKSMDVPRERKLFDYATGEIGVFYGRGTGKFARDFESGYLMGTAGNEHMQISAGASYETSNGHFHWR